MNLVWPALEYLDSYRAALQRAWYPDNLRPQSAREELERIETDPRLFIEQQVDLEARGPRVIASDGTLLDRIPGYRRWMWDGEFCGTIGFRWIPGTVELPPHVMGHIGYSVVPWKRKLGYATAALRLLLDDLRKDAHEGLTWVELTTQADNVASRRVIESNGGVVVGTFNKPHVHGGGDGLRYRIYLDDNVA
jgi:predicted acetyltransferase